MAEYGSLEFEEQIKFFRDKLNLPTEKWTDILKSAHDRAFVVAGAMKADLLNDLRQAVDTAISKGTTLEEFRKDFDKIVAANGWTGWTGEKTKAGRAWRTKVIYETNLYSSYAAGRYAQMMAVAKERPYWRYRHNDNVQHPRPLHLSWDGLILRHDHPWWKTHYTPNGWGCKCYIETLAERDIKKLGINVTDQAPNDGFYEWQAPNGTLHKVPNGIDPGWDYAHGGNPDMSLREMVENKLFNLDAPIGANMWDQIKNKLATELHKNLGDMIDQAVRTMQQTGTSIMVGVISPGIIGALKNLNIQLKSSSIWLRDNELIYAIRESKELREQSLPESFWRSLPGWIELATPYLDTEDNTLIYAMNAPNGTEKIVVRVNFVSRIRDKGKRLLTTANFIRTAGIVKPENLRGKRYIEL